MKQFGAILVSFIYLTFSIGLVVNIQYCHGEIEEISLITESTSCCTEITSCCSETGNEQDKCCSEIQHYYQVVPDMLKAEQIKLIVSLNNTSFFEREVFSNDLIISIDKGFSSFVHKPPESQSKPLWIVHCSFTFYG